ncbi:MAG: hypothetical protein ACE5FC_08190, partial [Myxococcota bacterium]
CLFLAAILCFIAGNRMAAIALAGAVIITQKSGGPILPVFALALLWRHGPRGLVKFAPYLLALVPLILMQGYLYFLFGDPFVNARVQHETGFPNVLGLPFSAMAAGLGKADQIFQGDFWLRKALLALSCLFYTGVFALSWKGRAKPDRVLMLWLAMVLLFNLSLAGPWAYYAFPRFMTLAVPPAILLLVRRLPPSLAPRTLAPLALAVPVLFWIIARDVQSAVDLMMRTWTPRYFELLLRHIL